MLTGLRLRNIALIEALDLDFEPGFTVLTGETGAGKSILLDALDALFGGAQGGAAARLLRPQAARALVEARFSLTLPLALWLERHQLEVDDDELVLSREWRRQDDRLSSRYRLQGVVIGRTQVQELRPLVLDLTVQGQTQQLGHPGQQRRWLDRFAGDSLLPILARAREVHQRWAAVDQALEALKRDQEQLQRDREQRQQWLDDLEEAGLQEPGELTRLTVEQDRLAHGVRLQDGVMTLLSRLVEGVEGVPSVLDHLAACDQELAQMELCDPTLVELHRRCLDDLAEIQDLARDLDRYGALLESDPERLAELQERLVLLRGLERRHGRSLAELIAWRDELRDQLTPGGVAAALAELEAEELVRRQERDQVHGQLREQRQQAATVLESDLMETLRPMGLANVRFTVRLNAVEPTEEGSDAVQFLFSANPGQPMAPLVEVASGGEMSRFLLALKTCLAAADPQVTLLFDEIDSGVSGRVSGAMAALLRRLAEQRQVFCVTHQPLVAAAADHHYRVSKQVVDGVTFSRVSHLRDTRERQQELAELAGGESGDTHRYAASLLNKGVP
ncbi:MAG: DNA repair protein RecN [Cyanobacteriota bacterium]